MTTSTATSTAVVTALVTVVHGRHDHLSRQTAGVDRSGIKPDIRCVVAMDDPHIAGIVGNDVDVLACPDDGGALPLARARNAGARHVLSLGADLIVFLDVDCIPGVSLIERYVDAHERSGSAVLSGPVTYLPAMPGGYPLDALDELTDPHPARPDPPVGTLVHEPNSDLFWSLSFAVSADAWYRIGGFCEEYVGYGGEDTDFGAVASERGVPLIWVGGAHAYHQHHPVSDPPVEHLADIVVNARIFRRRWGRWPMTGWLDAFEERGLIIRRGDDIALRGAT